MVVVVVGGGGERKQRATSGEPVSKGGYGRRVIQSSFAPRGRASEEGRPCTSHTTPAPPFNREKKEEGKKRVDVCVGVWVDGGGCACRWVGADPFAVTWFNQKKKKKKKHPSAQNEREDARVDLVLSLVLKTGSLHINTHRSDLSLLQSCYLLFDEEKAPPVSKALAFKAASDSSASLIWD